MVEEELHGEIGKGLKKGEGWSRGQDEALGRVRHHLFQEPE